MSPVNRPLMLIPTVTRLSRVLAKWKNRRAPESRSPAGPFERPSVDEPSLASRPGGPRINADQNSQNKPEDFSVAARVPLGGRLEQLPLDVGRDPSEDSSAIVEPSGSSVSERLWNQAYDGLELEEPKVVKAYETFLLAELEKQNGTPSLLSRDADRAGQMKQLVEIGLQRTEKAADAKQRLGEAVQFVDSMKETIGSALQAVPAAALAWVGVSFGLECMVNSLDEARINREGLLYVLTTMKWYWSLTELLIDKEANNLSGLRTELEDRIIQLYQKLLLYQMKSICLYHKSQIAVISRDAIKLDDWTAQVDDIKAAEADVRGISDQYNSQKEQSRSQELLRKVENQYLALGRIESALREQIKQQSQHRDDERDSECRRKLFAENVKAQKISIMTANGDFMPDLQAWIQETPQFRDWLAKDRGVFWVKGDPGKGKTMLVCNIINDLERRANKVDERMPVYFFCQATDARASSGIAVIRSLIHSLARQRRSLISYVRERYDDFGEQVFQQGNVWETMLEILKDMLGDPICAVNGTILIVDALDECCKEQEQLIDLIISLSNYSSVKWFISSRNDPSVEGLLSGLDEKITLQLELNADYVSTAVKSFIKHRVDRLEKRKGLGPKLRRQVEETLREKADNTFLWVALVCKELASEHVLVSRTLEAIKKSPKGLTGLYKRMIGQLTDEKMADNTQLCQEILAVNCVVYRPISLQELVSLVSSLQEFASEPDDLRKLIGFCGSFINLRSDDTVYFVHQSAKEFLVDHAQKEIFPRGIKHQHRCIFLTSLKLLTGTLKRDIYHLQDPGIKIDEVSAPENDPLACSRYSCVYWVDHLQGADPKQHATMEHLQDNGTVHGFLKDKCIYWVEAMTLLRSMAPAIKAMLKLQDLVAPRDLAHLRGSLSDSKKTHQDARAGPGMESLSAFVHDAIRFMRYWKEGIETHPLQLYASALLFSPRRSLVRMHFEKDGPVWVTFPSTSKAEWDAMVQSLEGHENVPRLVAVSPNGAWLASGDEGGAVKIWDAMTGVCIRTFNHSSFVRRIAFTADEKQLVAIPEDAIYVWDVNANECEKTVWLEGENRKPMGRVALSCDGSWLVKENEDNFKVWDVAAGACTQTVAREGPDAGIAGMAITADGTRFAVYHDYEKIVQVWDSTGGKFIHTLKHDDTVQSIAWMANDIQIAVGCENSVKIWDTNSERCIQTLHVVGGEEVWQLAFTRDGRKLAGVFDDSLQVWDLATGRCTHAFDCEANGIAFTSDAHHLISAEISTTIKIRDVATVTTMSPQMVEEHSGCVESLIYDPNGEWLASASDDPITRIWDAVTGRCLHRLEGHFGSITAIAFTTHGSQLASASNDKTIRIWDPAIGACSHKLVGHTDFIKHLAYMTGDGALLASGSWDKTIRIWDTSAGTCIHVLAHPDLVLEMALTNDGKRLASCSFDQTVRLWDTDTGTCLHLLEGRAGFIRFLSFSADSTLLAFGGGDDTLIRIWNTAEHTAPSCLHILTGHTYQVESAKFTADGQWLASTSYDKIRIWDTDSGNCVQIIDTDVLDIEFGPNSSTELGLSTNRGTLVLNSSRWTSTPQQALRVLPKYRGYGSSPDGHWIWKDGKKRLWLPEEYRPCISQAFSSSSIAIGCRSGRVLILHFKDS